MKLNIKPLSKIMGAEISGINLKDELDDITKKQLCNAITDYLVVCIRNQELKPKDLANVSRVFGTPKNIF
jgi:alpha-ketoglutarate-dependent taurine dioxygenase